MVTDVSKDRLVPFSSKLAFGVGQFAEGLKNTAFAAFVLFYYNQVLGLPGTLAGAALFIALVVDAVTDPLAGSLSDNHKSRLGRRHPFMYASAVPLGMAFVGLFAPPSGLGEWGLFAWLVAFAILTRVAMTLYHVPHLALGAEMTETLASVPGSSRIGSSSPLEARLRRGVSDSAGSLRTNAAVASLSTPTCPMH